MERPYMLEVFASRAPQWQHTQIYMRPLEFSGTGERARIVADMEQWCRDTLGPEDIRWSHPTVRSWLFQDSKDAMLFKLRWAV